MPSKIFSCSECNKEERFVELYDVKKAGWKVIGIRVESSDYILICNKCLKKKSDIK